MQLALSHDFTVPYSTVHILTIVAHLVSTLMSTSQLLYFYSYVPVCVCLWKLVKIRLNVSSHQSPLALYYRRVEQREISGFNGRYLFLFCRNPLWHNGNNSFPETPFLKVTGHESYDSGKNCFINIWITDVFRTALPFFDFIKFYVCYFMHLEKLF